MFLFVKIQFGFEGQDQPLDPVVFITMQEGHEKCSIFEGHESPWHPSADQHFWEKQQIQGAGNVY